MLSSIKNKLLGLSGSYAYYKKKYEELSEENKRLMAENEKLKDEKDNFIMSILSNQLDLNTSLEDFKREYVTDLNKITTMQETTISRLEEYQRKLK